jgi:hypothetical protein
MIVVLFTTNSLEALRLITRLCSFELNLEWTTDIVWLISVEIIVERTHPTNLKSSLLVITISIRNSASKAPLVKFFFDCQHKLVSISFYL